MIAADQPNRRSGKLLTLEATGAIRHVMRADLASQFHPGDVVIANHASTLPASLSGTHRKTGDAIEVRLAAWVEAFDPSRFVAIAFGAGDYLTPTEERGAPPALSAGDHLELGSLVAVVERLLDHPRLFVLRFLCNRGCILSGIARSGRPIQYAHVPEPLALWDVWTSVAANPIAFEPPSAGFALNWRKLTSLRSRGVTIATLAHAAGISSTGDPELDARLPFDEPYAIPERTAAIVNRAKVAGGRIVAVGTTVVRALESAVKADGMVKSGDGVARNRIGPETRLRVVDAILTGMHGRGESHFELLRAFADDRSLDRVNSVANTHGYRDHEFGDSLLIERQAFLGDVESSR